MAAAAFAISVAGITVAPSGPGTYNFIITYQTAYWDDIQGNLYNSQTEVTVATTATPAQMKTALVAAMIAKAAEYGFTLLQANIMYETFGKG